MERTIFLFFSTVCFLLLSLSLSDSEQQRRYKRQPDELASQCRRRPLFNVSLDGCNGTTATYFYYEAETRTCYEFEDCSTKAKNRFASMKTCMDVCGGGNQRRAPRRCQPQLKGKAPDRCRWVRAAHASPSGGCPKYQLQCSGGPCSTRPCQAPCEICTYNLEFTVRNCSLITRIDGDGEECPPPFRCERDIRCKPETDFREVSQTTTRSPQTTSSIDAEVTTIQVEEEPSSSFPTQSADRKSKATADRKSPTSADLLPKSQKPLTEPPSHPTLPDPSEVTAQETDHSACSQPSAYESCLPGQDQSIRRVWYFDNQSKICRRFQGTQTCSANDNGFSTKEECVRICHNREDCPKVEKKQLPVGCRYEERKGSDGCLTLAMVCTDKPGRCPLPTGKNTHNVCFKECERDADCKDEMKCCANGCASLCLTPAPSRTSVAFANTSEPMPSLERVKAGACPKEKRYPAVLRRRNHNCSSEQCSVDDDCSGAKKCCPMVGCGRVCRAPLKASPPKTQLLNPCSSNPCLPTHRCSASPDKPDQHICEQSPTLSAYDPCKSGKHTCASTEHCIYEPRACLTGPCAQYRCAPAPSKRKSDSSLKRKANAAAATSTSAESESPQDPAVDPCTSNPCRPCQRCVQQIELDAAYRCENSCPGKCEECALSGRCVVINQPYVCRTNKASDPCRNNRTCEAYPSAKCTVDPCHCLRAKFRLEDDVEISSDECRLSAIRLML